MNGYVKLVGGEGSAKYAIEVSESRIDIRISASQQQTILAFLLMFGDSVTVISPETLKKLHIQEIKKLNQLYS